MENRINELESILTYQEKTIKELNGVVVDHSNQILKLEKTISTILAWIQEEKQKQSANTPVQKPPHY